MRLTFLALGPPLVFLGVCAALVATEPPTFDPRARPSPAPWRAEADVAPPPSVEVEAIVPELLPPENEAPPTGPIKKRHRAKRAATVVQKNEPDGVAPEDAIRMELRRRKHSFEQCYEQELKKQASFDGFVVVALSLAVNGSVTDARVEEGTQRDRQVGRCIAAQLRRLQLPPLDEETELLIPIRLQAKRPT